MLAQLVLQLKLQLQKRRLPPPFYLSLSEEQFGADFILHSDDITSIYYKNWERYYT